VTWLWFLTRGLPRFVIELLASLVMLTVTSIRLLILKVSARRGVAR
jgi:hypothetical protein